MTDKEMEQEIRNEMLAIKEQYKVQFPDRDADVAIYAAWRAACRSAHYWRSATLLMGLLTVGLSVLSLMRG